MEPPLITAVISIVAVLILTPCAKVILGTVAGLVFDDHRAIEVTFTRHSLCVELTDGRQVSAPLEWSPALAQACPDDREEWDIRDDGNVIAWPHLCERISVPFLLSLRAGGTVSANDLDLFGGVKA